MSHPVVNWQILTAQPQRLEQFYGSLCDAMAVLVDPEGIPFAVIGPAGA